MTDNLKRLLWFVFFLITLYFIGGNDILIWTFVTILIPP
jgi:hypothetical protein